MMSPFINAVVTALRESPRYRLSAIIEMARLSSAARGKLKEHYAERCWPLLQQEQFANLRDVGPWLFGARPGSEVSGQYDFLCNLGEAAGPEICGWITSALPPEQLARHLSHASMVSGTDGHPYMLRYHTPSAMRVLSARRDLPGITDFLAPIQYWWVPVVHPQTPRWCSIPGYDRPDADRPIILALDEACWEALAGDPLSHRIAEILKHEPSSPGLPEHGHSERLGLIQYYLNEGREQGLSREDDLITYVSLLARYGEKTTNTPGWPAALADACDNRSSFADGVQNHMCTTQSRPSHG